MKQIILVFWIVSLSCLSGISLKEVYDQAPAQGEYDKYLELETGQVYTGGLLIGRVYERMNLTVSQDVGKDVRIVGNGAILDLQGEQICISFCNNRLDIDNCIFINGGVRFRGIFVYPHEYRPAGSVEYCTFYEPHDYAIRIIATGNNINIERNIFVDAVKTGNDFNYVTGLSMGYLPTGVNYSQGYYYVSLIDNWSYYSDSIYNQEPINHFAAFCDDG
jgi:hypothetical protein